MSGRCRGAVRRPTKQASAHPLGIGSNFLNQKEVNVSGNETAKDIRRVGVRLTERTEGAAGR